MKNKQITKNVFTAALAISFVAMVSMVAYAYSTGITGKTHKGPDPGCTCHDPNPSTSVSVIISGPGILAPGITATYTVKISGGPLVKAGTNIAVSRGVIDVLAGSGLQKMGDELTHTDPKAPLNDTVSFSFQYTAPVTLGFDTLYANGNSVNFDNSNSGDMWNFAADKLVMISVPAGTGNNQNIKKDFKLYQNYPNPFNPSTSIKFDVPKAGDVKIVVYDAAGKEMQTLVNSVFQQGSYETSFNGSNLNSGVYFYKITANGFTETKRMLLIK
ncbi:MAG: choice-of-anchor V domain-containing protein [Ignavibacteriota bacterium]